MNFVIVKTPEHIEMFKQVMSEHKTVSKIDAIGTGLLNELTKRMEEGASGKDPYLFSWLAIDDDGALCSCVSMRLGERVKCWYAKTSFATKIGRERYGVNKMFDFGWEQGFKFAEERGYYEVYYTQRIGRHRQMEKILKNAPYLKDYKIEVVETMPPYTKSINPLVNEFMLGVTSGLNPKPIVLVRIYNPEKVTYEYPYPQKN